VAKVMEADRSHLPRRPELHLTETFAPSCREGVTCWFYEALATAHPTAISGATALSGNCAVVAGGAVQCFDDRNGGPLVSISGISGAKTISLFAGSQLGSCVTTARGTVLCWPFGSTAASEVLPSW
jgi:hypothetical protein